MNRPLDELFFEWLYSRVADARETDPSRTHWLLFKQLYSTEFFWIIPNDDNRIFDGKELRREFLNSKRTRAPLEWLDLGCSVLEMMVGLAQRISFEDLKQREPRYWFWELLRNLGLDGHTDDVNPRNVVDREIDVEDCLNNVIYRTYRPNGHGGFFPLRGPCDDQRDVDIWYQMGMYLHERSQNE